MIQQRQIILYFDDPPLKPDVPGTGLSRVNTHILDALSADVNAVIVRARPFDARIYNKHKKIRTIGSISAIHRKLLSWIGYTQKTFEIRFWDRLELSGLGEGVSPLIFAPIGTSLEGLMRASVVAKCLNADLALFLVDDLLDNLKHHPEQILLNQKVIDVLSSAAIIFCVTEALALRYMAFNKTIRILPMPYEPRILSTQLSCSNSKNDQLIFLGNPSHFYQSGISALARIIADESISIGVNAIRATFGLDYFRNLAAHTGAKIEVKPFTTELEMAISLNSTQAAFAPYSFAENFRQMTESSFPSKLFEYLGYAKKIVVWAPEYSSAALFFRRHNLPGLCVNPDSNALIDFLQKFLNDSIDYSKQYQKSMLEFNYSTFRDKFILAVVPQMGGTN